MWGIAAADLVVLLGTVATLVVLEGLLSADNALVLAVMVRHLPRHQQKRALRYGMLGAFGFRLIAVVFASTLLHYWILKVLGGLYLLYIAVSHLAHGEDEPGAEHRLELCRLAIRGDEERFDVSDLEIVREGPSYTVDTLEELHSSAPEHELFLIVGGDIAAGLPNWHGPERVLSLATLAVAKRRGTSQAAVDEALSALRGGERTRLFRMPRIGISSTMLRERVHAGEPIRYYVPESVERYIDRHHLYAGVGSVR